jgi:membrane glycosyltransferase
LLSAIEAAKRPEYFFPGLQSLFPRWPQIRTGEIAVLFGLTLVVLLVPKVLGAILTMRDRQMRRQFGGSARLCVSLLVEQLFSVLLAPSMMLFHSVFVAQTLLGRSVSWNAQSRTDRGVTFAEAFRRQWWHLALGLLWGAIMLRTAPQFFWWLTPVLAGLICSIPLTVWTSRIAAGERLRRWGLLLTPEETAPPPELLRLRQAEGEILLPAPAGAAGSAAPPPVTLREVDPAYSTAQTPGGRERERSGAANSNVV